MAYRYAATPHRKFVIADCPGHVQYTRNMATGASTADLALVLVDATAGLREQSRRHICIAALLGVDQLVVCANKMDLVEWDRSAYQRIVDDMEALAHRLGITSCTVIPISALNGDNVVERSDAAPWYDGPTVLDALESASAGGWAAQHGLGHGSGARLPVQWVLRQPGGGRTYAGMVNGGPFRVGDQVVVLPQGARTTVRALETADGPLQRAEVGQSISLKLADHLDVSRGDLIAAAEAPPEVTEEFEATVCWFGERPLRAGDRLRSSTRPGSPRSSSRRVSRDLRRERAARVNEADRAARERDRRGHAAHGHAAGRRPLRGGPHHRQLRPDRRAQLRHHRGRHGRAAPAP